MKIVLGADGAGKPLIDVIETHLRAKAGHEVTNLSQPGLLCGHFGQCCQCGEGR